MMNVRNLVSGKLAASLLVVFAVAGCGDNMAMEDAAVIKDLTMPPPPPDMTVPPDFTGMMVDLAMKPCPTGAEAQLTADITANRTLQGGCTYILVGDTNNKNYLFVKNNAVLT